MKYFKGYLFTLILLACILITGRVSYADDSVVNIPVIGTNNYSYAYDILKTINSQRADNGLNGLLMDTVLLNDAMKRAAEISVYYSHTRPDGRDCFSAFTNPFGYAGENIAIGYTTTSDVSTAWYNSKTHRSNILNPYFTTVGIGCYKSNSVWHWVQLFSSDFSSKASLTTSTKNVTNSVLVSKSHVSSADAYCSDTTLTAGNTASAYLTIPNEEFVSSAQVASSGITYSTSDSSVFTVSSKGIVTAKGAGSAKLTMKLKSLPDIKKTITITVSKTSISTTSISGIVSKQYTGKALKQSITVKKSSLTLKEGTDYSVSYKNNTKPGTASIIITGKGSYTGSITKTYKIYLPKVTGITRSSYSSSSIALRWNKVGIASGYIIQKYNSSTKKYSTVKTITSNTTSATLKKLSSGTVYSYKLKAFVTISNIRYYGEASDVLKTGTRPLSPANLKITNIASGHRLTWSKVSKADGYELYALVNYSGSNRYVKLTTITSNSTISYTDKDITAFQSSSYRLKSYKIINGKKLYSTPVLSKCK